MERIIRFKENMNIFDLVKKTEQRCIVLIPVYKKLKLSDDVHPNIAVQHRILKTWYSVRGLAYVFYDKEGELRAAITQNQHDKLKADIRKYKGDKWP